MILTTQITPCKKIESHLFQGGRPLQAFAFGSGQPAKLKLYDTCNAEKEVFTL